MEQTGKIVPNVVSICPKVVPIHAKNSKTNSAKEAASREPGLSPSEVICFHIKTLLQGEATKMQLFRRAHFVITFSISFYAHLHILCQLKQNCKTA